jgi:hypothetical protein
MQPTGRLSIGGASALRGVLEDGMNLEVREKRLKAHDLSVNLFFLSRREFCGKEKVRCPGAMNE